MLMKVYLNGLFEFVFVVVFWPHSRLGAVLGLFHLEKYEYNAVPNKMFCAKPVSSACLKALKIPLPDEGRVENTSYPAVRYAITLCLDPLCLANWWIHLLQATHAWQ